MQMPEMDGLTLARMIKSDPTIASTRLALLTSLGQQLDEQILKGAGIEICLEKPIRQSQLLDSLISMITKSPAHRAGGEHAASTQPTAPASIAAPRRDVRILVAEDNTINQKVALAQLKELGYTAETVANGLEVLDAIQRFPYDLILMDCQMPELDGFDATRRIREREKALADSNRPKAPIHVIAMTANAMLGAREKCLEAGMDDYISKPVELDELKTALERWTPPALEPAGPVPHPVSTAAAEAPAPATRATTAAPIAPASESAEPPVNVKRLTKVTSGDPVKAAEMIDLYLSQARQTLHELGAAIQAGAAKEVERFAHKLLGASSTCGMNAIVPSLRELERIGGGQAGELADAGRIYLEATQQFDLIERFLNDYRKSLPPA
jgi:CheY-like chemotaxis protein/HPt (histidine-containing phosphotransfer) domain-containing protein